MEIWKETHNRYEVSDKGNVRNKKTGRLLSAWKNNHGYRYVSLWINGLEKRAKVARLVAKEFIPNPEQKPVVDHKNRNREDDSVENLRWVSYAENSANSEMQGWALRLRLTQGWVEEICAQRDSGKSPQEIWRDLESRFDNKIRKPIMNLNPEFTPVVEAEC